MKVRNTEISQIITNDLSNEFYQTCSFCDKIALNSENNNCYLLASQPFYCTFCLRHHYYQKSSNNILMMSYRSVMAYYYFNFYEMSHHNHEKMWLSQIKTMIDKHVDLGLNHPLFNYDPSNYVWFLDFNHIGIDQNNIPIHDILLVAKNILSCFEISSKLSQKIEDNIWHKFQKAIVLFYEKRHRPKNQKMLVPTFAGDIEQSTQFWKNMKKFTKNNLILK